MSDVFLSLKLERPVFLHWNLTKVMALSQR